MALTRLQRTVCRLLAQNRIASGESYVAGGAALNELIAAPRLSRDVDLFHDTEQALAASWKADRSLLESNGYAVSLVRERRGLVEAEVSVAGDRLRMEWARDSAFRFFPLVIHEELGLTLHPFDLATNKVLALVGRTEVRDFVDAVESDARIQPLGYLAWAACGKDPGFSPASILEYAARTRYSADEVRQLSFEGDPPDPADLSRAWHRALDEARVIVTLLPAERAGTCVIETAAGLFRGSPDQLRAALASGHIAFHSGSIRGAWPSLEGWRAS